jgi:hypothetical protein
MIPVTCRGAAVSDTASSAVRPPNRTVTSLTSSTPAWSSGAFAGPGSELLFIKHVLLM